MRGLRENRLVHLSIVALVMAIALGTVVSATSSSMLDTISPLAEIQAAIKEFASYSPWLSLGVLAASFMVLFIGLAFLAWRKLGALARERTQMEAYNADLVQQVEEHNEEVNAVAEFAQIVTSTLHINEVYERFALEVKKLVDFDRMAIYTINPDDDTYTPRYNYGPFNPARPLDTALPLEGTRVQQSAKIGNIVTSTIGDGKPRFDGDANWDAKGLKSVIMLPLVTKGRVVGVFGLRSRQSYAFGPHQQDVLERLAKQIAPAVENAELYERLQAQTEAMALVDEVARIITSTLTIEDVYQQFALEMKKLVDFDRTSISTINWEDETFTVRYVFGPINSTRPLGVPVPLSNTHTEEMGKSGKPLRRVAVEDESQYSTNAEWAALGIKSSILLPLFSKGKVIGAFGLRSRQSNAYGSHDQKILERLAKQIAPALEKAQLFEQVQAGIKEMALTENVARTITSTLDIEDVYQEFALEVKKLVDFDRAAIMIINSEEEKFIVRYAYGDSISARPIGISMPLANTPLENVVKSGKSLRRVNFVDEPKFNNDVQWESLGLKSGILVPLISKGVVVGIFALRSCQADAYGPRDQDILERLAKQIAPAIVNAQLFEQTKAAEEQLSKLSCAVEQSSCGVLITDVKGVIQYINPKFTRITGYTPEEIIGDNPKILNGGQTKPEDYQQMWETISSGQEWHGEFINRKKNGDLYCSAESISPIRSSEGTITHYVAVEEDVTARKQLEEQLLQAQKMESVGRLAGGIAHEFNNLLTIILGYSQMAKVKAPPSDDIGNYLDESICASERAAKLTSQLLAFSRKQRAEPKVVNLNDLILNIDKMLRPLIGTDIELVIIPSAELASIMVDSSHMEQVLINLAVNARDAMPKGGKLVIETANHALDEVKTNQQAHPFSESCVLLTVRDSGIGMSDEVKSRLFEPFFTTKGVGEGTGLGLSTCYGVVEQMGGFIEVESKPNQGTTFKIHIPATEEVAVAPSVHRDGDDVPRGAETILVAEDEPALRAMVVQTLRAQGYDILESSDGDEALRLSSTVSQTIHALVTDVIMPGIGGPELAERLCAIRPDIKVLFTSGYTDGVNCSGKKLPEDAAFLQKPYMPDTLAKKVREVLDS